jgi:hypothetical protein
VGRLSDVVPALSALREMGAALGVVSNFDSRVLRILDGLDLSRWFSSVTLSSQVGATKPAPAIFVRALAQHGVDPSQALHVGDSPGEDGDGAVPRDSARPDRSDRASRGPSRARADRAPLRAPGLIETPDDGPLRRRTPPPGCPGRHRRRGA